MASPEHHNGAEYHHGARPEHRPMHETAKRHEQHQVSAEQAQKEIELARKEALSKAIEEKKYNTASYEESGSKQPHTMSGQALKLGFTKTMDRTRSNMSFAQKTFSKVIHNPAIEKTSDIIGSTVARPDAVLSGSLFAFILTTALYFIAKYYGFSLSGSETILAFVAGWLLGILFDLVKGMFRSSR
jgi:hypothetical protein